MGPLNITFPFGKSLRIINLQKVVEDHKLHIERSTNPYFHVLLTAENTTHLPLITGLTAILAEPFATAKLSRVTSLGY